MLSLVTCIRYGPKGSGKTMMVEAICNATGAVLINLTASNHEKAQSTTQVRQLLHRAFTVARDPNMVAAVIYIDKVEQTFAPTKKASKSGPTRFKKDLTTYINSLKPVCVQRRSASPHAAPPPYKPCVCMCVWFHQEESVMVIGCTNQPWACDQKAISSVFQRHLYMPYPKYGTLVMLWKMTLRMILKAHKRQVPAEFDVSSLAHISTGYSSGEIVKAIKATMTERRVERVSAITPPWFAGCNCSPTS